MEKEKHALLPSYGDVVPYWSTHRRRRRTLRAAALLGLLYLGYTATRIAQNTRTTPSLVSIELLKEDLQYCKELRHVPTDSSGPRERSARWNPAIKPVLIRNATVWSGEAAPGTSEEDARAGKGYAWTPADVLLEHGMISRISPVSKAVLSDDDIDVFDAAGRQLTAGIVDAHNHGPLFHWNLDDDLSETTSDITPYAKVIDGINLLDEKFLWMKSGGVTTLQVLPGSANNMGGEAVLIKTAVGKNSGRTHISVDDMLADPEGSWRYMKMALGMNPKSQETGKGRPNSRLGQGWKFRTALQRAQDLVQRQDAWCTAADASGVERMSSRLPREMRWESLGALLRGQVRLNTHCYTVYDFESFVRLTNEFKFRLRAFHHAHQAFLATEIFKRAWGGVPAAALFHDLMYYKDEAYIATERAGKILWDSGITPLYVTDSPALGPRALIFGKCLPSAYFTKN